MKVGDKLRCINSVNNVFGDKELFIKNNIYEVIWIDPSNAYITLDHVLYGNEYSDWTLEFINMNFINIRVERKNKLKKINENR